MMIKKSRSPFVFPPPPGRERRGDIIPFADTFLGELKNVVERMVILSQGNVIRASELPFRAPWRPGRVSIGDEPLDLRLAVRESGCGSRSPKIRFDPFNLKRLIT